MSTLVLPQSMVADRDAGIKANAQHVDDNFNALASAVNGKLDLDGTSTPTADITLGNHKLTNVATPTLSGDATTKGYVDSALLLKADLASPTFTGTPTAPTVASVADKSTKIATTKFVVDVLESIYPVGSLYIGTQNSCPMSALFGTWALVATDRALWGGNGTNANTTIAAGLPNITGADAISHSQQTAGALNNNDGGASRTGALQASQFVRPAGTTLGAYNHQQFSTNLPVGVAMNASLSSSVYGQSNTVQPPAYRVNVWRRTA